jgi:hypothetical protein
MPVINYIQNYYFEISRGNYLFYNQYIDYFEFKEKKDFISEVIVKIGVGAYSKIFDENI